MFSPNVVHFLAPKTISGWCLRLSLLLLVCLGIGLLPDLLADGRIDASIMSRLADVVLFGMPLAMMLIGCLVHLDRAQQHAGIVENTDLVTGVLNRRQFLAKVTRALPQSGVMLMFDIDYFKAVNDNHGHDTGDLFLMSLSQRLRELTRKTDIVGRLDGAAFAVYLPGATLERGCAIGDRLSKGVQVVTAKGVLQVTLSVGAVVADGRTPLDELMRDADRALERAKVQGRARLIVRSMPAAA